MQHVKLTFTGIDRFTDLSAVMRIGRRHPHVEFAVLVGSRTGRAGANRYPDLGVVRDFRNRAIDADVRCAVHLCGSYSRAVMKQQLDVPLRVSRLFDRIQINSSRYNMDSVVKFTQRGKIGVPVIVQWRRGMGETSHFFLFLYGESGGRGRVGLKDWPTRSRFGGFAGGISPANIREAAGYVRLTARPGSWLDMESGVRTDDWFDLAKVEEVIALAAEEEQNNGT